MTSRDSLHSSLACQELRYFEKTEFNGIVKEKYIDQKNHRAETIRIKRATGGLLFTNPSHDMQNLGSKMVKGAPVTTHWKPSNKVRGAYSYTWETTGARGGTTFMKKPDAFIKATGAPR